MTESKLSPERREQLRTMLARMSEASSAFYRAAVQIGCHPFIEITGFMNEYIKICSVALAQDIDFADANAHSGAPLMSAMQCYNAAYIGEKFGCIFETSFNGNEELIKAFTTAAFSGK